MIEKPSKHLDRNSLRIHRAGMRSRGILKQAMKEKCQQHAVFVRHRKRRSGDEAVQRQEHCSAARVHGHRVGC